MENPALSRRPDIASKKRYNGGSATTSKAIYDDVFGGPPKFGAPALSPRVEDYSEIFGGFHTPRATSIPVLDLPLVDDDADEAFFDVRSSGFNYSEVFGGFGGRDFAVSFEDLVMGQSNGLDDSSDEAWTPEADYLSEESDHFIQDKRFSNGDSGESIDGCTVFNISYNKSSEKLKDDFSIGIGHTTQLHDVSGYTFMVDKVASLPNSDYLYARDYDDRHNIGYSGAMPSSRHLKKAMSQPANGAFLTISNVSLKTRPSDLPPPSRPPPALNVEKDYSDKTTSSFRSVSEESAGDNSPPYFDVEVDASSSAAAAAAAVKNSTSRAQQKLKKAKESRKRNGDAFQSCSMLDSKNVIRDNKEKGAKVIEGSRSIKGVGMGLGSIQGGEDRGIEFSDTKEQHKHKKKSQIISDSFEGNYRLNMEKSYAEENEGSESLSSQGSDSIDVAGEWKEATQFFQLVTNKSKKIFDKDSNKTVLEHDSECYDRPQITFGMARAFERDKSFERSEVENKQKVLDKRVQITEEACRDEPNEKKFGIELQSGETEKRRIRAYDLQKHSDRVMVIESASRQTMKHKDKGSQWKEDGRSMGNAKKFPYGEGDSDRRSGSARELEENEKKSNVAFEPAENEIRLKKFAQREEKEKMEKDIFGQEENGKRLRESAERKESERRQKEAALEKKENERRLKEICENEERLKREKEATEREENEKRQKEIIEREENEIRLKQALELEEMQRRQREAPELEKAKRAENEMRLKALEKEENKSRQEAVDQQKNEKKREEAFATEQCAKQQLEGSEMRCEECDEREEMTETIKEACESDSGERTEEVCRKPTCRYLEEVEEIETELKADEKPEKVGSIPDDKCESKESKTKHVDAIDKEREIDLKTGDDYIELNQVSGLNDNVSDKTTKIIGKYENGSELEATKEMDIDETSKLSIDPSNEEEATTSGIEQKFNEKIKRQFQVNMNTGNQGVKVPYEGVDLIPKCHVKEAVEAGENTKGAQPAMDPRGSNQRATQHVHTSQSTEKKGKKDTLQQEDKESERMKRERDLELDRLKKMEEERDREREREKDRMAVDPTILETRERAYTEVRQRTLNDARERLEKACMEAREKSFTDNKASVESRIRAERAAVGRATAEAREHVFQKAMAESQQSQGAWMSNGSKYQYSSFHSERYGVEGESPQRCKARLERYRRTAERAANALQELNMRDLHNQREQAERNRLAETLDADVKRWSSGKEGNLRALLSTLQYILGPDSGWRPIHLTEVITATAVKKAYKKATLCVHPDKLQQRGASIQQKYICEKVFDLLKEAWNRFNSEER